MDHPESERPKEYEPPPPKWQCLCGCRKWQMTVRSAISKPSGFVECIDCRLVYHREDLVDWHFTVQRIRESKRGRREPGIRKTGKNIAVGRW